MMDAIIAHAPAVRGTLTVPPDKAICHRAVLLAALASGATDLHPWPAAEDCQRTLDLVMQLGVPVRRMSDAVRIEGRGPDGLSAPTQDLSCGESGTTLRLAAGLLAGQPFVSRLTAAASLSRRPMRRIIEPLSQMGARIDGVARDTAPERYPPLTIHGTRPLRGLRYTLPVASAQVKSAILLAAVFADGPTTVIEPVSTRDHTERMLRRCGVLVHQRGREISIEPGQPTAAGSLHLPGDFSSAAFFLVAASCVPGSSLTVQDVSLNPTRCALLDVLRRMGASITVQHVDEAWEPRGTLTVEARPLRGVTLTAAEVPGVIDELPVLMVAAAVASGTTRLEGVGELRVKETDRMDSMVTGLQALGARIRVAAPATIEIEGAPLRGARVEGAGDHRTVMSLAVAGLCAADSTTVRGAECVAKSYPEFFDHLRFVAGSSTVKTVDKPDGLC